MRGLVIYSKIQKLNWIVNKLHKTQKTQLNAGLIQTPQLSTH